MSKEKKKQPKPSHKKELLIALIITLAVLLIVVGATLWYQSYKNVQFDTLTMIIVDVVGSAIMFAIIYHFVKKPDNRDNP